MKSKKVETYDTVPTQFKINFGEGELHVHSDAGEWKKLGDILAGMKISAFCLPMNLMTIDKDALPTRFDEPDRN